MQSAPATRMLALLRDASMAPKTNMPHRCAVREYLAHYHRERNHQGLENRLIEPVAGIGVAEGTIERRERLGGMLNYYHRRAA